MHLDPKALEAAHRAYEKHNQEGDLKARRLSDDHLSAVVRAYLSASIPAEMGGLVERLQSPAAVLYTDAAASALLSLSARVGELEKALGPFAEDGEMFGRPDKYQRAARAVLDADEMAETAYRARLQLGRTLEGGEHRCLIISMS